MTRGLVIIFLMLRCAIAHAADLVVTVTEAKTGQEKFFRVETDSLSTTKLQATNGEAMTKIAKYEIKKRKLIAGDRALVKADDILFQCNAGNADFVVVRQEYNSLRWPHWVLSAFAGHPIQVSRVVIVKIADGNVVGHRKLAGRASSYEWRATISQLP
jgi:hypothetical protein